MDHAPREQQLNTHDMAALKFHIKTFSAAVDASSVMRAVNDSVLCYMKEPSIVMDLYELMESTSDEQWLNYYHNNTEQLSRLTVMQIVCAYHCFIDVNCVAFVHVEQLTHTCNLIHFTQSRCFPRPQCFSYSESEVSFNFLKLIVIERVH